MEGAASAGKLLAFIGLCSNALYFLLLLASSIIFCCWPSAAASIIYAPPSQQEAAAESSNQAVLAKSYKAPIFSQVLCSFFIAVHKQFLMHKEIDGLYHGEQLSLNSHKSSVDNVSFEAKNASFTRWIGKSSNYFVYLQMVSATSECCLDEILYFCGK